MIKISKVILDTALVLHANSLVSENCAYSIDYSKKNLANLGIEDEFLIEYRYSAIKKGAFFGIYLQVGQNLQAKLINVIKGSGIIYLVDLRKKSPNYCKWDKVAVIANNYDLVYIPKGFGHAFLSTEDDTIVIFKQTVPNLKDSFKIIDPKDTSINLVVDDDYVPYCRDVNYINVKDL